MEIKMQRNKLSKERRKSGVKHLLNFRTMLRRLLSYIRALPRFISKMRRRSEKNKD